MQNASPSNGGAVGESTDCILRESLEKPRKKRPVTTCRSKPRVRSFALNGGGDLAGKHSIRINDQWRVVFRWTDAGPEDVEIVDYH
jgi:hypothetical protein